MTRTSNLPSAASATKALSFGPPNLGDTTRYTVVPGAPLYGVHTRFRPGPGGERIPETVDEEQLAVLCRNTAEGIANGRYPIVTLGHTTPTGPETEQPPVAGYIGAVRIEKTRWMGEDVPTIVGDLYVDRRFEDQIDQYPRRSAEIVRKMGPTGFLDGVALLKRLPALPFLGNISRNAATATEVERFEYDADHFSSQRRGSTVNTVSSRNDFESVDRADAPFTEDDLADLARYAADHDMAHHGIQGYTAAARDFLKERRRAREAEAKRPRYR